MKKVFFSFLITAAIVTNAQKASVVDPFIKPIQILERSFKMMGGDSLATIKSISLYYNGIKYMDGQSARSTGELSPLPWQNAIGIDFAKDRLYSETMDRYRGGYIFHFRTVYGDSSAFNFEVPHMRFHTITDLPLSGKAVQKQTLLRSIPVFLVRMALDKKQTLRYQGTISENAVTYDIVSFAYSANLTIDLWINDKTGLLDRYQFYTDHPIHGNQLISYQFQGYRKVNNISFPFKRIYKANNIVQRADSIDNLQINNLLAEELFKKPADYKKPTPGPMALKEIGKNIFMAENVNGYNPLFLNFGDHLVAIEAVNGSADAMQLIKKKFPGLPIQNVIISHHHEDHSGGLPDFLKDGIPVITTSGNQQYVASYYSVQHALLPQIKMPMPKVEVLDKSKEFTGSGLTMRVLPFNGNSHADQMLVFYFPEEKILYQADLLISSDEGEIVKPLIPVNRELYDFIIQNHLDVEKIYGVHMKPILFKDLESAIKESGNNKTLPARTRP